MRNGMKCEQFKATFGICFGGTYMPTKEDIFTLSNSPRKRSGL